MQCYKIETKGNDVIRGHDFVCLDGGFSDLNASSCELYLKVNGNPQYLLSHEILAFTVCLNNYIDANGT